MKWGVCKKFWREKGRRRREKKKEEEFLKIKKKKRGSSSNQIEGEPVAVGISRREFSKKIKLSFCFRGKRNSLCQLIQAW